MRAKKYLIGLGVSVIASSFAYGHSNRTDFDIDNDGLIEIYDLDDLNDIRNHLTGDALYGQSVGCPQTGCYRC